MKVDDGITLRDDSIAFSCPFCGKDVIAGVDIDSNDGVVLHAMDPCQTYRTNTPDEFLRLARI